MTLAFTLDSDLLRFCTLARLCGSRSHTQTLKPDKDEKKFPRLAPLAIPVSPPPILLSPPAQAPIAPPNKEVLREQRFQVTVYVKKGLYADGTPFDSLTVTRSRPDAPVTPTTSQAVDAVFCAQSNLFGAFPPP